MILWAMVICAVVGFVLGTQCRLLLLAIASALVAAGLALVPGTESAAVSVGFLILGLLVVLQAFFLAGAVLRTLGPRVPFHGVRPWREARAAEARYTNRDLRD